MYKRLRLVIGCVLFLMLSCAFAGAETIDWYPNSNGIYDGVMIKLPTGESLDVTISDTEFTISGTVDVDLVDTAVTIPGGVVVSGAVDATLTDSKVTVENTVTVDGSGVTQPVSIATMPSTPVTGTFYQGTQPVSLATNTPLMTDVTLADTIIDLTLTDSGTVYNVVLPAKCVAYEFWAVGTGVVKFAMSSAGIDTNYMTLKAGYPYSTFSLGSEKIYSGTIYFRCPLADNEIMCIRIWTKP